MKEEFEKKKKILNEKLIAKSQAKVTNEVAFPSIKDRILKVQGHFENKNYEEESDVVEHSSKVDNNSNKIDENFNYVSSDVLDNQNMIKPVVSKKKMKKVNAFEE